MLVAFRTPPTFVLVLSLWVGALATAANEARADTTSAVPLAQRAYTPPAQGGVDAACVRRAYGRQDYPRCRPREWSFSFGLPVWIPGVTGTLAEGDVTVDAERSAGEVYDDFFEDALNLQFAFVGSFTAQYRKWFLGVDGFGASLGSSITFRLTNDQVVEGSLGAIIGRAVVGRQVCEKPVCLPLFGAGCVSLNAFAGVRLYHASFDVKLPLDINVEGDKTWVDPIVGLAANLDLGRRWTVGLVGDIGGFDVGSEFAWWLVVNVEYHFSRHWSLWAGYAWLDVDYQSDDIDRFRWNLHMSGPILAIRYDW